MVEPWPLVRFSCGMLALVAWSCELLAEEAATTIARRAALPYKVVRDVPYRTDGEQPDRQVADIYLPHSESDHPTRWPTILMVHGGAWFAGDKSQVALHASYAASRGYAVVAMNYRLAPKHKFPAQLDDCRRALAWLGENAPQFGFDDDCVFLYGYSAGANLACLLGMSCERRSQGPPIRGVVAGGAPCEFQWIPDSAETLSYWLGGTRNELPQTYAAASPITFVDPTDPPVFLYHGEKDRLVPISSPRAMLSQLRKSGVKVSLHVVPNAGHMGAFLNRPSRERALDFLAECLSQNNQEASGGEQEAEPE